MNEIIWSCVYLKEKEHKNINKFRLKVFGKTTHFDANCMNIGFKVFKILKFYVFKMATNGDRYFEMQLKLKIIKLNLFLKNMNKHIQFTNVIFDYYVNNHFMG